MALVLFYSIHHNARMMWNEITDFFFFSSLHRLANLLEMESVENGNFSPKDFFLFGFFLFIYFVVVCLFDVWNIFALSHSPSAALYLGVDNPIYTLWHYELTVSKLLCRNDKLSNRLNESKISRKMCTQRNGSNRWFCVLRAVRCWKNVIYMPFAGKIVYSRSIEYAISDHIFVCLSVLIIVSCEKPKIVSEFAVINWHGAKQNIIS